MREKKCDYCSSYNEDRIQCWYCGAPLDIGKLFKKRPKKTKKDIKTDVIYI
jgi:hypothetical protein